jgi:diguanylate cyclase (GGDEF)-like protein
MTGARSGEVVPLPNKAELALGRSRSADVRIDETGVSRVHCTLSQVADGYVVKDLGSTNGTFVNGRPVSEVLLRHGERLQLGPEAVVQLGFMDAAEETLARRLYDASTRDSLTGLFNRRHFCERLETELAYARRHRIKVAVMMVDLDYFKSINDGVGHAGGDAVLRGVAQALLRSVRVEDVVARYGGEEFALLVRVDSSSGVSAFAERIRERIEALRVSFAEKTLSVTASIGVAEAAELGPTAGALDVLARADRRLYEAKRNGRNRVCAGPLSR